MFVWSADHWRSWRPAGDYWYFVVPC